MYIGKPAPTLHPYKFMYTFFSLKETLNYYETLVLRVRFFQNDVCF